MLRENNGQSAAKPLNSIEHEERSTTIPRKGSNEEIHEKVDNYIYNFTDKLPKFGGIYCIKNIVTNKMYIGSCINFHDRKTRHLYYLKNNIHHSKKLQRSYNKYGINSFKIEILEIINLNSILLEKEKYYLDLYNSYKNGYNSTEIINYSSKRFNLSKEQIEKRIKVSSKPVIALDLNGNFVDRYDSISEASKDLDDQPTNISKCCRGLLRYVKNRIFIYESDYDSKKIYKLKDKKSILGIKRSIETKRKLSLSRSKSISKYDLDNNLMETYISVTICAKENKTDRSLISKSIKENKPHKGFVYKYN